jgi:spore coat protein U-like protein
MSIKIINPGRLIALICLLAAWAGLEGARTPASAASPPPPSGTCSVGIGAIDFGQVDVLLGSAPSTINMIFRCDRTLGTVYFCIGKQKLNMIGTRTGATLTYDITPLTIQAVFSSGDPLQNRGLMSIVEKISDNQQMVPPDDYSTASLNPQNAMNVAYSTTEDCVNATMTNPTPTSRAVATVQRSCKIATSNLDFGITSDLSSAIAGQSQINVRCTNGTGYTVGLDGGLTGAADPTQRKMKHGADTITYGLYRDSNHSLPWGSTIGINVAKGTGSSMFQPITVFGNVPSVQSKPASGTYSDTIVVSVSY